MKNIIPRIAAVHDLSGIGRCSLTAAIPILSVMGMQVCPLPTAVLSTQTGGFEGYEFVDMTAHMKNIIEHWKTLGLKFDCIYSGFLGSEAQISIVSDFISDFRSEGQIIVVDPVFGDDGEIYDIFGEEIVERMKELIRLADVITPNITEAAFLLDKPCPERIDRSEIKDWLLKLSAKGPKTVIITSVPDSDNKNQTSVAAYDARLNRFWKVACDFIPTNYPGTGDIFTSVLTGCILQGDSLPIAIERAVQFVSMAIRTRFGYQAPPREGVLIEKILQNLQVPITSSNYEIL